MMLLPFEILACIIDALLSGWFIKKFNKSKIYNIFYLIFLVLHSSFNIANLFVSSFSPFASVVNLVMLIGFSLFFKHTNLFKRFLAPIIFESTLIIVNTLIVTVIGFITGKEFSALNNDDGITRILMIVMSKLTLWILLSLVLRITDKETSFKFTDCFLLILFPIALFFILAIMVKIALAYPMHNMYGYFLAAIFSLVSTYIGIYYMVFKIMENNRIQSEKNLYQQMLKYEEKRYTDMEEGLNQIKKIRHDIKHRIGLIKFKLDDRDYTGANLEIEKILKDVSSTSCILKSNNKILDYIVNTKLGNLDNASIVVDGNVDFLNIFEDIDLSIILGNLIDNALAGVKGVDNAIIQLSFSTKGCYHNIVCKNTIKESVLKVNPNLNTTKNHHLHGFGIKSIQDIVSKYFGQMHIYEEKGYFIVHINLHSAAKASAQI